MAKYKVGDTVVIIRLDEDLVKEQYDFIGMLYKETLFRKGVVTEVWYNEEKYTVEIEKEEWYYLESELMLPEDFTENRKKVLSALYGYGD